MLFNQLGQKLFTFGYCHLRLGMVQLRYGYDTAKAWQRLIIEQNTVS